MGGTELVRTYIKNGEWKEDAVALGYDFLARRLMEHDGLPLFEALQEAREIFFAGLIFTEDMV